MPVESRTHERIPGKTGRRGARLTQTDCNMNKMELARFVAAVGGMSIVDAMTAVNTVFDTIAACLQNGRRVTISGFGSFESRERRRPAGCNLPAEFEPVAKTIKFKPTRALNSFVENRPGRCD